MKCDDAYSFIAQYTLERDKNQNGIDLLENPRKLIDAAVEACELRMIAIQAKIDQEMNPEQKLQYQKAKENANAHTTEVFNKVKGWVNKGKGEDPAYHQA